MKALKFWSGVPFWEYSLCGCFDQDLCFWLKKLQECAGILKFDLSYSTFLEPIPCLTFFFPLYCHTHFFKELSFTVLLHLLIKWSYFHTHLSNQPTSSVISQTDCWTSLFLSHTCTICSMSLPLHYHTQLVQWT